jgi:hypothetical protein
MTIDRFMAPHAATAKAATSRKLATRLSKQAARRGRLRLRLRPDPQNPRRGPART